MNPVKCFFGSEGHVELDRNLGLGYNTLLWRLIQGDLLSACPNRQLHLLDSRATLSNSYPNALRAMQGGSLYHFSDGRTRPGLGPTTYRVRGGHANH